VYTPDQATAETLENTSYLVPPAPPLPGCKQDPIPEKPTPGQHRDTQQNSLCDPHSNPPASDLPPVDSIEYRTVKSMGFLDYDVEIRKIICSINVVESLNAHYRRAVRARGHFPTEQAVPKCLYLVTRSLD
jgi:hypothetical protein